jgi:hypothetical protein
MSDFPFSVRKLIREYQQNTQRKAQQKKKFLSKKKHIAQRSILSFLGEQRLEPVEELSLDGCIHDYFHATTFYKELAIYFVNLKKLGITSVCKSYNGCRSVSIDYSCGNIERSIYECQIQEFAGSSQSKRLQYCDR